MKSIVELRNDLANVFDGLKSDNLDHRKAKEMNQAAGKILQSMKIQIEYAKHHKKRVVVAELEDHLMNSNGTKFKRKVV